MFLLEIESYDQSLETEAVVSVIESIIDSEKPHLRYPVGDFALKRAQERFSDPTGDSFVPYKNDLLKEIYRYDLLGQ
ncbi:MAG: hypothetical protein KDK65_01400 [Chlamydiia bacterium]|nr:hypothetical protein [Chlamydiia bacterium]